MANYQNLISAVDAVIKTNNRREITGQILQNVLNQMIGSLGENMQLSGFATPATDPHSPDQNVFYFATQAGVYQHFDNIVLDDGFSVLMWKNGQWTASTIDIAVTRQWVQSNFVSIEWFRKLFRAYTSNSAEVQPNDMTTVIDNIKAMFGLWTDEYLSALGIGQGGGGGGASYLADLLDVELTNPSNGQALVYNSTLAKWVNGTAGVDMSTVWANLAASGNEQINASHLSTALSDYVTATSLSTTLASYATQTWVSQNYISIAYFDRLFRAYNGSTLVNHNDTTTTIDNIKAMFGFWTEYYLSALGNGGQAGSAIYLSQLADVVLSSPSDGQALVYDATNSQWVNGTVSGVTSLSALSDVLISAPSAGQALTYDAVSAKWQNTSLTTSLLSDIVLSSIQTNQVLIWDSTSAKWVNSSLKTINSQSLIGSGDISVGGGASGNYLPIAGGTMSGDYPITFTTNRIALEFREHPSNTYSSRVEYMTSGNEALVFSNGNPVTSYIFKCGQFITNTSDWTDITPSMQIKNQSVYINSLIANGDSPSYNLYVAGTGCFTESLKAVNLKFEYQNEINSYDGSTQNLHLNYRSSGYVSICKGGGNVVIGGSGDYGYRLYVNGRIAGSALCLPNGGRINVQNEPSGSSFFIGNSGNQGWVRMQDVCGASGTQGDASGWSIRISGNALFANVQSNGYVTALSDIRHKTIIKDTDIQVDEIAKMPAVVYQWNDGREDKELHVGSIAQDWQSVLPEVVLRANDKEGTLSMSYGVAGLISAIVTARKVVNHEARIKQLEKEIEILKSENRKLTA